MSSFLCSQHHAVIYDRGGERRMGEVGRISEVEWNRDRDGVSEAHIVIQGGKNCESQRKFLRSISEKRHELVIYRGTERLWEGPIFRISDLGSRIEIHARDVCAYLFGTMLSREWDNRKNVVPMTTRLGTIISYELATSRTGRSLFGNTVNIPAWESLDPPINVLPHLVVHHFPNEAETAARTLPFSTTVGLHLAYAARQSGIDYTAVGRAIHLWDTSRWIGETRTLTEADFYGNIIVTGYGADHTQLAYSTGQDGMYGEAVNTNNLGFYGPWSTSYSAYNEDGTEAPTQGALNSQAARNASGRSPVPVEVRVPDNSSIRLSDTLQLRHLVPGVRIPLLARLNSRTWNQAQKLDHLTVIESEAGEEIKVTMSPANREDADVEE